MDRDTWLRHFEAAPEPVQAYLLDEASAEAETRAQTQLGFEHDAWDRAMAVAWDALFAGLPLDGFQRGLQPLAGTRDPVEIEKVLATEVLYPLADLLAWDFDARMQQLGVPAGAFQGRHRISLRPMSYGAAVRRIAVEARLSLLGEDAVRRVREIFVSYLKRIRTIEQVEEILRRPAADGGMGWSPDQAKAFLHAADDVLKQVPVLSEEEYSRWVERTQREAETERIRQAAAAKQAAAPPPDALAGGERRAPTNGFASVLDQAIEEALALANVQGLDEYLSKRLRNVVSTRLRGVRSPEQVREVLAREDKVGGLGRSPEETERIATVIEQMYAERHAAIAAEDEKKVTEFVQEQERRLQDRREKDAAAREAWYQGKLQSVAQGETGAVAALKAVMQGVRLAGPTCDLPGQAQVSLEGGLPAPNRVDGVQGYVRLTGLTEELEAMDIARFRRLAKTPADAKKKVLQMFDGLKQESYERWAEGIRRWRQSPLQGTYLQLVSRAFAEQRPVIDVAQALQAQDRSALTPEEVGAILEINEQLAF